MTLLAKNPTSSPLPSASVSFTVITTPMMLVGTWYGMNFDGMQQWPELGSGKKGYFIAIGITTVSTMAAIWYFKVKKWF